MDEAENVAIAPPAEFEGFEGCAVVTLAGRGVLAQQVIAVPESGTDAQATRGLAWGP